MGGFCTKMTIYKSITDWLGLQYVTKLNAPELTSLIHSQLKLRGLVYEGDKRIFINITTMASICIIYKCILEKCKC